MKIQTLFSKIQELAPVKINSEDVVGWTGYVDNVQSGAFKDFGYGITEDGRRFISVKITVNGQRLAQTFFQRYLKEDPMGEMWTNARCCDKELPRNKQHWVWAGDYYSFAGNEKTEPIRTGAIYDLIMSGKLVLSENLTLLSEYPVGTCVELGWK
jgi:hypothetical protein